MSGEPAVIILTHASWDVLDPYGSPVPLTTMWPRCEKCGLVLRGEVAPGPTGKLRHERCVSEGVLA